MRPRTVRPIEYEVVPQHRVTAMGLPQEHAEHLHSLPEVAVLRCVDDRVRS